MGAELSALLAEATLASSMALLLVLGLRRLLRATLGASAAYGLWMCVPAALLAVLLPRGTETALVLPVTWQVAPVAVISGMPQAQASWDWRELLAALWLAGVCASAMLLACQQRRFHRGLGTLRRRDDGLYQSTIASAGLPAVAGTLRPRILLPADFEQRYTGQERELVIAHERLHVRRGDLAANAFAALLLCLFWFNPLLHIALRRFRLDQELACDEQVIARHPEARRRYGEAMLKTQFDPSPLPLGCHWQARHPILERIDMLKRPTPSPLHWALATLLAISLSAAAGYTAWATQPASATIASAPTPAVAAAVQEGAFLLTRQSTHDSVEGSGVLSQWVAPGEPAVSIVGTGTDQWKSTATVETGAQPGTALVRLRIERGDPGTVVAEPVLAVREGEAAAVEKRDDAGKVVFRTQLLVLPLAGSHKATEARMRKLLAADGASDDRPAIAVERMPPPRYPKEAAQAGVTGEVILIVSVAADGSVTDVEVERARPDGVFDAGTVEAARQWKFTPAMEDGKAVPGRVRVPVTFELDLPTTGAGDGA